MRKSKAETAQTRQRIVEAAAKAFRRQGIDATGVAEIMAAAGMTHGGFYRHFQSKDQLVAEAMSASRKSFVDDTTAAAAQGAQALLEVFQDYVTEEYRDDVEDGCPLAANGSELVRADETTRHRMTASLRKIVANAAPFMRVRDGEDPTDTAISLITNMVGALTVARLVDDPALSARILQTARCRINSVFEPTRPGQPPIAPAGTRTK
jgi:TetR/AcrR family transcriptional repressor of nem operon